MSKALDDLDPRFRPQAIELIARCTEAGIPVMIIDTLRTPAEHAINLANGTSWTNRSKHLDGLAIDLAPYDVYQLDGPDTVQWNGAHPAWAKMGAIGKRLGLRWGGDFKKPAKPDLGHFEYVPPR